MTETPDSAAELIRTLRDEGIAVPVGPAEVRSLRWPGLPKPVPELWDPRQPIAMRTHVEPPGWKPVLGERRPTPRLALLVVTVPRPQPGEPLWFGVYGMLSPSGDVLVPGLFYADDIPLPDSEKAAFAEAARRLALPAVGPRRRFLKRLYHLFYKGRAALVGWDPAVNVGHLSVGWAPVERGYLRGGLGLMLWSKKGLPSPKRPHVFRNFEVEDGFRPRISFRSVDGAHNLISVGGRGHPPKGRGHPDPEDRWGRRVVVSVHALAEAQRGGEPFRGLVEACQAYGLPPPPPRKGETLTDHVEAAVAELHALAGLYQVLIEQHRQLMPQRPPSGATSTGSYASALLERTGLRPRLELQPDFPREVLAAAMAADFGGEVSVRVRAPNIPVFSLDVGGLYGVAAIHCRAWELYAAQLIDASSQEPETVTASVRRLARRVAYWRNTPGAPCPFRPQDWQRLARTVLWVQAAGDVLPHKVSNKGSWRTRVAAITFGTPVQTFLPDLLDTVLETGQIPEIVRAVCLVPSGRQPLRPVRLPTGRQVDPNREDLIAELTFERARLEFEPMPPDRRKRLRGLLKGMVNSIASGLPIQILDDEPTKKLRPQWAWDPVTGVKRTKNVPIRETPGAWYFPPIAAGITSCGRLILHLAKGIVEAAGGTVAYYDTDSLYVVATPDGGLIPMPGGPLRTLDGQEAVRALSYVEVEQIRRKLETLSPFPPEVQPYLDSWDDESGLPVRIPVPRLWKREPENNPPPEADGFPSSGLQLDVNAAKKPRLYYLVGPGDHVEIRDGQPVMVPPTPEQRQSLTRVVMVKASEHGVTCMPPAGADPDRWVADTFTPLIARDLDLPAEGPDWVGQPAITLELITRRDKAELYPEAWPFTRLAVWPYSQEEGRAVAAWHRGFDPQTAEWWDAADGRRMYPLNPDTGTATNPSVFAGKTIGSVIRQLRRTAEHGAVTADGLLCVHGSRGVLTAGPTVATGRKLIGKESRRWGDGRGVLTGAEYLLYEDADSWPQMLAVLREVTGQLHGVRDLAARLRVDKKTVHNILRGTTPSATTRTRVTQYVAEYVARRLSGIDITRRLPDTDAGKLAVYLEERTALPGSPCQVCGEPFTVRSPSQLFCGHACRERAYRQRQTAEEAKLAAEAERAVPSPLFETPPAVLIRRTVKERRTRRVPMPGPSHRGRNPE